MLKKISLLFLLTATVTAAQPNFVFILVDDMSWTGTSVAIDDRFPESKSDFYQTPNIEILARQGMSFSRAYSPSSMCTPSRAGILTGKTPAELHMTTPGGGRPQDYQKLAGPDFIKELPKSEITIAEILKEKGYATAHFGKWHLGSADPGQHGFDHHDGATANDGPGAFTDPNPKDVFGVTERSVAFMSAQAASNTPFYLQLSHYAVHSPVEALDASVAKFEKLPKGARHDDADYAAMTFDLDTSIGILISKLKELGLSENTYLILMSDNGGPGNRRNSQNLPLAGGKGTLFEGGIRVPLILSGPDIPTNTFCHETVTGCDLLPTICAWAGVESPQVEGMSLLPLLTVKSTTLDRKEGVLFHYPHYGKGAAQKPQSAIILGKYKLLKDLESGSVQLFDLDADDSEQKDLSATYPEKAEELELLLKKRLQSMGAQFPVKNEDYDPTAVRTRTGKRR